MDIPIAVLADAANISQHGTLNILGIFGAIAATEFPFTHPSAVLVIQLRFQRSERGVPENVRIRLMDEDRTIAEIATDFVVPDPDEGGEVRISQIIQLRMMQFPRAGDYAFHVLVNGDEKAHVPFRVLKADQPGALQ